MRLTPNAAARLLDVYLGLAARCAGGEVPDELDFWMGQIEGVLAGAEVETAEDLIAKCRFLLTYRSDRAMIPVEALETLAAGAEAILGIPATMPELHRVAA